MANSERTSIAPEQRYHVLSAEAPKVVWYLFRTYCPYRHVVCSNVSYFSMRVLGLVNDLLQFANLIFNADKIPCQFRNVLFAIVLAMSRCSQQIPPLSQILPRGTMIPRLFPSRSRIKSKSLSRCLFLTAWHGRPSATGIPSYDFVSVYDTENNAHGTSVPRCARRSPQSMNVLGAINRAESLSGLFVNGVAVKTVATRDPTATSALQEGRKASFLLE